MTTTARHLTIVAVKAMGLLQIVEASKLLFGTVFMGGDWFERFLMPHTVGQLIWVTAHASIGLLLILRTSWVVDRLFVESQAAPGDELELGAPRELLAAGMIIAGVVLALFALPWLLADVIRLVFMLGWNDLAASNVRGAMFWSMTIHHGISFLVGLWFIRNWAGVLRRLTGSADFDPPERSEDAS